MNGSAIPSKQQAFLFDNLYIDPIGYQVKAGQKEIDLTLNEFNLLYLFATNRGKVVRLSGACSVYYNPRVSLMRIGLLMS